ncbi:MAG: enoyl-CoA hydratase/isomerase family protein [Terriglobales bacterium]|jgi:cyclohexa-1,5-dienecarbonyl-CoA hydratase
MLTQIETQFKKITLDVAPPAGRVTLTNAPVNVIDLPMMDELLAAIEQLEQRADVSFFIITGSARAFSAGVDVAAHTPDKVRPMLTKFHSVIRALVSTSKITMAAVRGLCLGGGAELALACDMIFCSEDSKWQFPEINLACFPPVAAVGLSQVVGSKRAAELVLTGQAIHGDEAFHMGLANDAVPAGELDEVVDEVGQRLAALSPAALALAKKAFYKFDAQQLDQRLQQVEAIYFDELMKTEDALEGINSFLEKRKPVWKGK